MTLNFLCHYLFYQSVSSYDMFPIVVIGMNALITVVSIIASVLTSYCPT